MQPDSETPWNDRLLRQPHAVADKASRVRQMFAAIASSYDLNNRLHSLWLDQSWRRTAVRLADLHGDEVVIDVACGTGDLTLGFAAAGTRTLIGVDFTFEMLQRARAKSSRILWTCADACALPMADGCADVVSIAFGIRNVADPAAALGQFFRVLKPGGRLVILEFSLPRNPVLRWIYNFYFRRILPRTATFISGDKTGAYRYLPESVNTFITPDTMAAMMTRAGFTTIKTHRLSAGICICYVGQKG